MLDGKSLQSGTSHYFGQNFAKAFDIKFLDKDGAHKYPYQSSWGVSTRLIGALIMAHGDERGLKLPPFVAPVQAVIVPIAMHKAGVLEKARELKATLEKAGVRVQIDESDASPGWKFNEYEMKGVPVRIELGPRDIENGVATVARRDKAGEKSALPLSGLADAVKELLQDIHNNMYQTALAFRDSHVKTVQNMQELGDAVNSGNFALSMWCGDRACEDKIKEDFQASSRNMPFDQTPVGDKCVCCGKKAKHKIYWGKAY